MDMSNPGFGMRGPASSAGPLRRRGGTLTRRAVRLALLGGGLACAMLDGGCIHAPRQSTDSVLTSPAPPSSAPPTAGRDGVPTVSVELNRTVGENTTFHKSAT